MAIENAMAFVLVLVRVASIFAFLPFLGQGKAPKAIKAMAALAIAMAFYPVCATRLPLNAWQPVQYFLFVAAEVLFGVLIGFSAAFVFGGIRMGGELLGRQVGMALAITADPISGVQATPIGNFCEVVGLLVFFTLNGHHVMLEAIRGSFEQWPLGAFLRPEFLREVSVGAAARGMLLAFQLSAPLLVLTFLVSLIMALMARLVSEINVLVLSFPLRIGVGLIGLTLLVPVMVTFCGDVTREMGRCMTFVAGGG